MKNINKYFIIILFFLYTFLVYDINFHGPDEPIYFAYTESIIEDGDLNVVNQENQLSDFGKFISKTYNFPDHRNHGGVTLWAPFYGYAKCVYSIVNKLNFKGINIYGPDKFTKCAMSFSTVIFSFFTVIFTYMLCRLFFPNKVSLWSTLIIFFGTPFFYYTLFETGNANIIATLFSILLIWLSIYAINMKRSHWFLFGLFSAICITVKLDLWFQIFFVFLIFIAYLFLKQTNWRNGVYFIFGFISIFILKIINDYIKYGTLYMDETHFLHAIFHFRDIRHFDGLFSAYRGVFYTSPILFICFLGCIFVLINVLKKFRSTDLDEKKRGILFIILILLLIIKVFAISSNFPVGNDLNARFLLTEFPVLVLLYAQSIQGKKKYPTYFIQIASVLFIFWNLLVISEYIAGLDLRYSMDAFPRFDIRIKTLKTIFYPLFYIKELDLKLKLWLPLFLVILGIAYINLKFTKPIYHFLRHTKNKDKNKLPRAFKLFAIYLCSAYTLITSLNIYNNKKNVEKLKANRFFGNAVIIGASEYHQEDPLFSMLGMMQYYSFKGDIAKIANIKKSKERIFTLKDPFSFYPALPKPYYQLAEYYTKNGAYERAMECYQIVIRLDPNDIDAYFSLGDIYTIKGNYDKAIQCFQKVTHLSPMSIHAYFNLGNLYNKTGNYDKAIECFEKAIRLRPSCAEAHASLGDIYYSQGIYEKAMVYLNKALQLNPNSSNILTNLGDIYNRTGNYDKAIECFQRSLQLNPNSIDAYLNLGDIYNRQGHYARAFEVLKKAFQLNPNSVDIHISFADIYNKKGEYQKAIEYLQKSVELNPNRADSYAFLGDIYNRTGNYDKAIECFQRSLQLNPNSIDAYLNLGKSYSNKGDKINALSQVIKLRELKRYDLANELERSIKRE